MNIFFIERTYNIRYTIINKKKEQYCLIYGFQILLKTKLMYFLQYHLSF